LTLVAQSIFGISFFFILAILCTLTALIASSYIVINDNYKTKNNEIIKQKNIKIPKEKKGLKAREKEQTALERRNAEQDLELKFNKIDELIKEEKFGTAKEELSRIILEAKTLKSKVLLKRAENKLELINRLEHQITKSNLENKLSEAEKLLSEYDFEQATKLLNDITKEANTTALIEIQNRAIQLNLRCQQIRRDLSKINTIKKTILELGRRVNRLQIVEISEASKINENDLIIDVVKEMINKNEIDATYFDSTKSVAFNIQPVGDEIDKLLKTFDDLEKQGEGKK
jgi:urease gamma subunit